MDASLISCASAPIPAFFLSQIIVSHEYLEEREITRAFDLLMIADHLAQFFQPITQSFYLSTDGHEQAVDDFDCPVMIAQFCADTFLLHRKSGRAEMHLRCYLKTLPLEGSHIDPLGPACLFKSCVLLYFPVVSPYLAVFPIIPIHRIHADTFPLAVSAYDTVSVFIKSISGFRFLIPLSMFIHRAHGAENMSMRIRRVFIIKMHSDVGNHAFVNELRLTVIPYQSNVFFNG